MKTNKKIRNELFFALIVLSLAVLFAFARLHINREKQTAGANTAEIFHQPWIVLIFHKLITAERQADKAVPCYGFSKRRSNFLKRRFGFFFRRFNFPKRRFAVVLKINGGFGGWLFVVLWRKRGADLERGGDTLHFFCTFAELQQRGFACMNFLILWET